MIRGAFFFYNAAAIAALYGQVEATHEPRLGQ